MSSEEGAARRTVLLMGAFVAIQFAVGAALMAAPAFDGGERACFGA